MKTENLTDKELLEYYQANKSLDHYTLLFQRYQDMMFGVCLRYLQSLASAQDAVMNMYEAMIPILKNQKIQSFRNWLYVYTKNYCLQQLRLEKKIDATDISDDIAEAPAPFDLFDEKNPDKTIETLISCMDTLPEKQKVSIKLFYFKEMCYKEIASSTGMEWNRIRSYIQNGRRNLKNCMQQNQSKYS